MLWHWVDLNLTVLCNKIGEYDFNCQAQTEFYFWLWQELKEIVRLSVTKCSLFIIMAQSLRKSLIEGLKEGLRESLTRSCWWSIYRPPYFQSSTSCKNILKQPKDFVFSQDKPGGYQRLNDTNSTSKPLFKFTAWEHKINFHSGFLMTTGMNGLRTFLFVCT